MQKYVADNDDFFEFLTKHTYPEEGKGGRWHHQQLEPVFGGVLLILWGGISMIMACCRSGALVGWMIVCLLESESYIFLILFGEWIQQHVNS